MMTTIAARQQKTLAKQKQLAERNPKIANALSPEEFLDQVNDGIHEMFKKPRKR